MMRFGVLCNGYTVQQWQLQTIRILVEAGHQCSLIILNDNKIPEKSISSKVLSYPYSKLLVRLWMRYLLKPAAKKDASLKSLRLDCSEIHCRTQKRGYAEYFESADIERIKSFELDFILRFGFSIIKGKLLNCARYGVWSYHHDDPSKYRGVPTGFWEILFRDPVNASVLQRLTDKLDGGVILKKGYFRTIDHSWTANLDRLLSSTVEWPLQVCRDIENGVGLPATTTEDAVSGIYKLPGNGLMVKFLWRLLVNKIKFHWRDLFMTESWNIAYQNVDKDQPIINGTQSFEHARWLVFNDKRSVYHADPFGFEEAGKLSILCERYDYSNRKGIIEAVQVDGSTGNVTAKYTALEKDYHLAFPFIFELNGQRLCIPENSEGNCVDLYRFDNQLNKLIFVRTLISGMQAVDPVLVKYDNKFWLFFTDKTATNERLHIWHSPDLESPFSPHANNPVKVDIRNARPAGNLFEMNGDWFRPAQDCSDRSGARVRINRIVKLNETEFAEEEFAVINPDPHSKYRDGLHTFCLSKEIIIFDGKQEKFVWAAFINKLNSKLGKVIKH